MKKINLMVTGLALGSNISGICDVCNYDFEWLIKKPASLIYADKIIIPEKIYETIHNDKITFRKPYLKKSIRKVFDIAEDFNLIEIKSPSEIITKDISQKIEKETEFDVELLSRLFPNSVKKGDHDKVPGQTFVDGKEYCGARLWSIYASLILAQKWKAESLFSDDVYAFCKYKFGLSLITNKNSSVTAFDDIFTTLLPEQSLFPHYSFIDSGKVECSNCERMERCEKNYLTDIEKSVHKYLELRDRDEIQQIKNIMDDITAKLEKTKSAYSHKDIIDEFHSEELKIKRDLKKTFPKIQRWTNISIIASTPATLLGIATGLPSVSYASASIAGISGAVKEMVAYSKNKYKWVGFLNKRKIEKSKKKK